MIVPWPGANLAKDPIEKLVAGYAKIGIDRKAALALIRASRDDPGSGPLIQ